MPDLQAGSRLRVCLATELFYPEFAGGSLRFQRYIPGLRARGIDVSVFCATPTTTKARIAGVEPTWKDRRVGEMLPVERLDGFSVHRVRLPDQRSWQRGFMFSRALLEFCRRSERRPDLVQLLSVRLEGLAGILGLRRLGIPIVYTGTIVGQWPSRPVKRAILRMYVKWPLQLMDCIVVSSEVMRSYFRELRVNSHVEVIPNGVDLVRFRPTLRRGGGDNVRSALGVERNERVLLSVGAVMPRKGTDLLLEMWARLAREHRDVHLVILGPRHDQFDPALRSYQRRLEELCIASGAPERVHFVGVVDNVEDYMSAADVLIFPSRREGMGNVVLEAMASGLPVVITPYIGLPAEFGEPGRQYILAEAQAVGLSSSVSRILQDRQLADELARAGREWVECHMDVESVLDRYATLYHELANGSRRQYGMLTR